MEISPAVDWRSGPLSSILNPGFRDYYNYFCVKPQRSGILRVIIMAMTRIRTHGATDGPTPAAVVHTADLAGLLAVSSSAVSKMARGRLIMASAAVERNFILIVTIKRPAKPHQESRLRIGRKSLASRANSKQSMQVTGQRRTSGHEQSRKSNCALSARAIMIRK